MQACSINMLATTRISCHNASTFTMGACMNQEDGKISGKARGGIARAKRLSAERRKEIAHKGALARWSVPEQMLVAQYGAPNRPLKLGEIEIPCYVLNDGTRVLAQRGLHSGIGLSAGGGKGGERKIVTLLEGLAQKGLDVRDLIARANSPIRFIPAHGGNPADGYEATILPDICAVLIEAGRQDKLGARSQHLAERAAVLQHAFATLGIIALVDEATGYQAVRPQDALQAYLEKVISRELAAWVKRFPDEFYENIYKLKNWPWPGMGKNRYSVVGTYTKDLVYERLGPGVLKELEKKNPKNESGKRASKHHQWLTEDIGNPLLAQHLHSLVMFQRLALANGYGWQRFVKMIDQVLPKRGQTMEMPLTASDSSELPPLSPQ